MVRIPRRIPCLAFAALLLMAVAPAGADEQTSTYVTGGGVTIHCGAEPHSLVPNRPIEDAPDPLSWLFSGEPECAGQDAINTVRERQGQERLSGGFGGAAVLYETDDVGKTLTSTPDDAVFGARVYHRLSASAEWPEEDQVAEGCGPLSIDLPYPRQHWQSTIAEPQGIAWDDVSPVGVTDDTDLCFSSAGELHFHW